MGNQGLNITIMLGTVGTFDTFQFKFHTNKSQYLKSKSMDFDEYITRIKLNN